MSLISVIVPVYKVEPYLNKCIESIANQTYKNLEIILVDDGSPDHCPAICDLWAEKDPRIKVIHQKNSGSAVARNMALDRANGDYISFVDSDDYIAPCFYENLISGMDDETDIVECGYLSTDNDVVNFEEPEMVEIYSYLPSEAMKGHIADQCFRQTIWNKLYRRRTIGEIRFVPHKRIDDEFFTYRVLGNAKKLARLSAELYAYRQQGDSIMHSIKIEQRIQSVEAKVERHRYICEKFPELKRDSAINLVFTCMYMGQLAVKGRCNCLLPMLKSTLKQYSNDMGKIQFKQCMWVRLAKVSFKMTCKLRNILHIGL